MESEIDYLMRLVEEYRTAGGSAEHTTRKELLRGALLLRVMKAEMWRQSQCDDPTPLKARPDFIAGYDAGMADGKRIRESTSTDVFPFGVKTGDRDEFGSVAKVSSSYISWHKNGYHHREGDLPAIIRKDGSQSWYKDGRLHRDGDLPAIVYANGSQIWCKDGEIHRDNDLPADVGADGFQRWYKKGVPYTPSPSKTEDESEINYWMTHKFLELAGIAKTGAK